MKFISVIYIQKTQLLMYDKGCHSTKIISSPEGGLRTIRKPELEEKFLEKNICTFITSIEVQHWRVFKLYFFLHYLLEHPVCRLEPISKSMRFVGRHHTIN